MAGAGVQYKLAAVTIEVVTGRLKTLVWQINIDWFQAVKGKAGFHLIGAFYAVICNNPCSIHYLPEETILVMVMPGPEEPSLEQMNNLLEPFVESMLWLEKGVEFVVYGHDDKEVSHS
ncbi:hypothetical protein BS17DRAFT_767723 [Gyrodon lividus]|nr:hypothetical protein BS17DRAFT_767723 [Gyrodon lividus]